MVNSIAALCLPIWRILNWAWAKPNQWLELSTNAIAKNKQYLHLWWLLHWKMCWDVRNANLQWNSGIHGEVISLNGLMLYVHIAENKLKSFISTASASVMSSPLGFTGSRMVIEDEKTFCDICVALHWHRELIYIFVLSGAARGRQEKHWKA